MAGGKVGIYTGLFRYIHDETDLAVVLAHEIAHNVAMHANERASNAHKNGSLICSLRPTKAAASFQYSCGYKHGASSELLRVQESEADRIGMILMANAGFDPRRAIKFWERVQEKSNRLKPPELVSTHPAPKSRIANLKKYISEALPYYQR